MFPLSSGKYFPQIAQIYAERSVQNLRLSSEAPRVGRRSAENDIAKAYRLDFLLSHLRKSGRSDCAKATSDRSAGNNFRDLLDTLTINQEL